MAEFYATFFRFPILVFRLEPGLFAGAIALAVLASLSGTAGTLAQVARLPPAEAMRPEAPPTYRKGLLDRVGLPRLMSPATRMIVRGLVRRPAGAACPGLRPA